MARKFGVHGVDRPAIVPVGVNATSISNAGMMFRAERGIEGIQMITNSVTFNTLFGGYVKGFFGKYSAEGFFKNLKSIGGTLFCKRYVPSDAVVASKAFLDGATVPKEAFTVKAGLRGKLDKGAHGNKVGIEIVHSSRYSSLLKVAGTTSSPTLSLESVIGFDIGEIVKVGETDPTFAKIIGKDEIANTITLSSNLAAAQAIGEKVQTVNFDIIVYRKNAVGVLTKLETFEYLTIESDLSTSFDFKINHENVGSLHILVTRPTTPSTDYEDKQPAATGAVVFLTAGDDGTAPTDTDWTNEMTSFNLYPIRFMFCPEATSENLNKNGEAYCHGRGDAVWLPTFDKTKVSFEQLKLLAASYLVSSDSYQMNNAYWLKVADPIGVGTDATVDIPNVGYICGHIIYRLNMYGYQRVPAGIQESLVGVLGLVNDGIVLEDSERTVLGGMGMNLIQFVEGSGYVLRNARMNSNHRAYKFFNQIFMRIFYKKTFEESFKMLENEEAGEKLLTTIKQTMRKFLLEDYNGNTRTGGKSAFLQIEGAKFEDVVRIICDASNNTLDDILNGNITADLYFTPPSPAESIEIGVGINLDIKVGNAA